MKSGQARAMRTARWVRRAFIIVCEFTSSRSIEPEVLQRICGAPVEVRSFADVSGTGREVAEGDPRSSAVTDRRELLERRVRGLELLRGIVEPTLLEQ